MGIFKEKWQEGQLEGAGSVVVVVDLLMPRNLQDLLPDMEGELT